MLKRFPFMLLAAVIGCTQAGNPETTPDATVGTTTAPVESSVALPDPSATTIEFYCPGMT